MSGSGGTQAGGPAPVPLFQGENAAFAPTPYPSTSTAALNAYNAIGVFGNAPYSTANIGQGLAAQAPNAYTQLSTAGNQYGTAFNGLAGNAVGSGQSAFDAGQSTYNAFSPYIGTALSAGFDPQNALYARTLQQITDQANAQNVMSGIGSTPYGAGVANQANENFNIDWQNNLLGRQSTAANTASTLAGAGNSALQGGTSALQAGQGLAGSLYGQGANAVSNLYGQGANIAQGFASTGANVQNQYIQDLLAYLGASSGNAANYFGAANNTYGQAVGAAGLTNQAAQQSNASALAGLGGLGSLAGSLLKFI